MKISCVILTMGNRVAELDRAVESVLMQLDGDVEVVVVGNGADVPPIAARPLPGSSATVKTVRLPSNVGIPEGRNRGVQDCSGDVVLFLDDDGWYPNDKVAAHVRERFAAEPDLAVISFQVMDPTGEVQRRHVPRLRVGDPERSSSVTTFLGGACAVRRSAFLQVGGLPEKFFYAHEETDLAWRLLGEGYRIEYDADTVMYHPLVLPSRHADFLRYNARNRVWLARRNLPWPLAVWYLANWVVLTVVRERSRQALMPWFRGFAEGIREPAGERRPMSWRTAWNMLRIGRPPIV